MSAAGSILKQTPPPEVIAVLAKLSIAPDDLALCTHSDIDRLGRYAPQWIAATDRRVLVINAGDKAAVLIDLPFEKIAEFRSEGVVGSGLLQARVNGIYVDLLRYSNRMGDRFEKVARKLDKRLAGEAIVIHPEEEKDLEKREGPPRVDKAKVFTRMWNLMDPYRGSALAVMGLMLIGIALDLTAPLFTRWMVDEVLPQTREKAEQIRSSGESYDQHLSMLLRVVLFLAAVQVSRQIVNMINGRLSSKVGTAITSDMRNRLVAHLQRLSVGYYDRQQVGALVGRVAYDTEALHGFVHQLTAGFLFQLILVVGVGAMMFHIDPLLAGCALLPAPLVVTGTIIFWKYVYPLHYRLWDASSKQAGMLSGILSGIRVVKAFGQERREQDRFESASDKLRKSRYGLERGMTTFGPSMGIVFQLGGWIVWYVGGREVLGGHITLGGLMAFFNYLWLFYAPLGTLSQFTNWLTQFATQAHRIFEILDTPPQIHEPEKPVPMESVRGSIEFQNVTFGYQRHSPVLKDINFKIEPGEMIGVVGRSGSGKSTIVNLICRFYDVDEGRVLVDGVDVRNLLTTQLRQNVGVVLQEPFLFRGSIYENLTYGVPSASVEQVIAASKAANCHDFVMKTAHGYDTWVGERGAGLSGGERQRASIARVLLTNPSVLILDEATSSVDAESEAAIQAALARVIQGRTTIAIAHRLSTLRQARRIVVVDAGRIAESGSHEELMVKDGLYAHLVKLQGQATRELEDATKLVNPAAYEPRWLIPGEAAIELGDHGTLCAKLADGSFDGVFAVRCLPVHAPDRYISLRYVNERRREVEVGLLRSIDEWLPQVQELIRQSLLKRYFVHTIQRVSKIEAVMGFFLFEVDTDLGPVNFVMRNQADRAQDYKIGGKLLLDVDENRYLVPDVEALPEADRRLFRRHIYW